jgi:integrase|tara:strand:- start:958 stop:2580 length:1623 start_codon:yes stop_codon:yes gene_type:complete
MTDKIKQTKLDTGLAQSKIAQTCTGKKSIKFTDYAIDRHLPSFIDKNNKTLDRETIPFENCGLKGLKLCSYRVSKKKMFFMRYWFNGKSLPFTFGEFKSGYGVRECRLDYMNVLAQCSNKIGHWVKDPKTTLHDEQNKISKAAIEESQKLTINQVIERICKEGFPKAKKIGKLSANSIKLFTKFMLGYNWRTRHLIYTENSKGHGQVSFKANTHKRTAKPDDWSDLFNKFPTGHGIIKDKKFNPLLETSLYDSDLGKLVIDELNEGIIRKYIDKSKRSYGTKENLLDAIKMLWNYSIHNSLFGDKPPVITFKNIIFKKTEESQYVGAKYNHLRFSDNELPVIYNGLMKRREKYPFQSEALLFLMFTGRREQETLKLKWSDVNFEKGVITMPRGITKARKVEYIDITGPIAVVLNSLKEQLKGEHHKYKFVDWLFPTTRTNSQRLHEDSYVRSESTKLKHLRGCWSDLVKELEIVGSPKMFRKTFSSIAKITLGTSSKARALTGHEQDATLDIHYDKTSREDAKEYAHQVAEVFNFTKKTG